MKPAEGAEDDGIPAIWEPSMRFGLTMTKAADPLWHGDVKRLTYSVNGLTNNTCIQFDGDQLLYGETGTVSERGRRIDALPRQMEGDGKRSRRRSGWRTASRQAISLVLRR